MELNNDFRVGVPVNEAWKVLTDLERIAPLMPGAQLQEVEGNEYRGIVKVKVGPITAQYKGTASFLEQDEAAGKVVLQASGRDTRGQGNASATITATMAADGDGTKVSVLTDLTVTGKVAQFGRGVLADVSGKMIGQFVDALEADLNGAPAPTAPVEEPAAATATSAPTGASEAPKAASDGGVRKISSPEPKPVDLFEAAGGSVAKRLIPLLGGIAIVAAFLIWRNRRHQLRAAKAQAQAQSVLAHQLEAVRHLPEHIPSPAALREHLPDPSQVAKLTRDQRKALAGLLASLPQAHNPTR